MKELIHDVEFALQALALRSTEMVDRLPIIKIIDEMNLSINDLQPSQERLMLKAFVEKLEKAIK